MINYAVLVNVQSHDQLTESQTPRPESEVPNYHSQNNVVTTLEADAEDNAMDPSSFYHRPFVPEI